MSKTTFFILLNIFYLSATAQYSDLNKFSERDSLTHHYQMGSLGRNNYDTEIENIKSAQLMNSDNPNFIKYQASKEDLIRKYKGNIRINTAKQVFGGLALGFGAIVFVGGVDLLMQNDDWVVYVPTFLTVGAVATTTGILLLHHGGKMRKENKKRLEKLELSYAQNNVSSGLGLVYSF